MPQATPKLTNLAIQTIYELVAQQFEAVNGIILDNLHSDVDLVEEISAYLVSSGGKRVRPLVTLLCAGALGDLENDQQHKLAAAIEFLHTATLLHDDVVDMSALRRGKPTANANWGNASSVLVGDFVYSRAFQMMVSIGNLEVLQVLSDTTAKIAEGEVKQLSHLGDANLSEADYFSVIENKTAVLFAAACECSAIIAGSNSKVRDACAAFGKNLGLAFQLVDDSLDYVGETDKLGKNIGDDLAEGKVTLPMIYALQSTASADTQAHSLLHSTILKKSSDNIDQVVKLIRNTGAVQRSLDCAQSLIQSGTKQLSLLPNNGYSTAMGDLGRFVLARSH